MRYGNQLVLFFLLPFFLLAVGCSSVYHLADEQVQTYRITDKTSDNDPDSPIEQMIEPYRNELSAEMNEMIGLAASTLEKGDVESTLGNWVADAVLAEAELITHEKYDFGICNSGGIRVTSLPAGPITRRHIYELMPFDNYLVTMEVSGVVVEKLFQHMAEVGGWPISHGVSYEIKNQKAQNILIHDQPIDPGATYSFVLSDYLAEGGGNLDFLKEFPYRNLNIYYRDALIEHVVLQHAASVSIDARIEGRVINLDQ